MSESIFISSQLLNHPPEILQALARIAEDERMDIPACVAYVGEIVHDNERFIIAYAKPYEKPERLLGALWDKTNQKWDIRSLWDKQD